jgi:SAM-dependent methyltransferase
MGHWWSQHLVSYSVTSPPLLVPVLNVANMVANPGAASFPEVAAGGFTRIDGTVQFYVRVNALLAEMHGRAVVLDFGAGRGATMDSPAAVHPFLFDLRDRAARVIGVDVDTAVRTNPVLDEAHVIEPGGALPFADGMFDLIVSDYTFEHLVDPGPVARELSRVLALGGWICARTPNKWGYIGLGARLIPNCFHVPLLARLQPERLAGDVFPTAYALNTPRELLRYFPAASFDHFVYRWDPESAYGGSSRLVTSALSFGSRLTPEAFRAVLMVFLRRKPDHSGASHPRCCAP